MGDAPASGLAAGSVLLAISLVLVPAASAASSIGAPGDHRPVPHTLDRQPARCAPAGQGLHPRTQGCLPARQGNQGPSDLGPPAEAYQPGWSKNWWYVNAHLFDAETGELRFDLSAAIIMDHGGDLAGHILLFSLVDYETGETIGTANGGVVVPNIDAYGGDFLGPSVEGQLVRSGEDPDAFELGLEGDVDVNLTFTSGYDAKARTGYQEGGGLSNVLFWNQATVEGELEASDGPLEVTGVGFVEHVWGTWSRVPQKGIDFVNVHLNESGTTEGPPTGPSVYFRRTFYHGTPASGAVLDDVGPVLYLSHDGETFHEAETITCTFDGDPCSDHRVGTPDGATIEATFGDGGHIRLTLDQRTHATIAIPPEEPLGNVHEGAADVTGELRLPGDDQARPVEGMAQTEHQRFGPFYPY